MGAPPVGQTETGGESFGGLPDARNFIGPNRSELQNGMAPPPPEGGRGCALSRGPSVYVISADLSWPSAIALSPANSIQRAK